MQKERCQHCGYEFSYDIGTGVHVVRIKAPDRAHTGAHAIVPCCPRCEVLVIRDVPTTQLLQMFGNQQLTAVTLEYCRESDNLLED